MSCKEFELSTENPEFVEDGCGLLDEMSSW